MREKSKNKVGQKHETSLMMLEETQCHHVRKQKISVHTKHRARPTYKKQTMT